MKPLHPLATREAWAAAQLSTVVHGFSKRISWWEMTSALSSKFQGFGKSESFATPGEIGDFVAGWFDMAPIMPVLHPFYYDLGQTLRRR